MWQRFTERARRVVFFAQEEAARWGENLVDTGHMLLGLVRESDSVAGKIIEGMGIDLSAIRKSVEKRLTRGPGHVGQDMQLTPRAKRAIDLAYEEARELNNNYIGTEHLIVGLFREGEGAAAEALRECGVTLEALRQKVRESQEQAGAAKPPEAPPAGGAAPARGDLGILRNEDGRPYVEVATTYEAVEELALVMQTRDHHGYLEMVGAGRIFVVGAGAWVKLLRPGETEATLPGQARAFWVRVLTGRHEGRVGWVLKEQYENRGPDRRPFPPPLRDVEPQWPQPAEPPAPTAPPAAASLSDSKKLKVQVQEPSSEAEGGEESSGAT